MEKSPDERPSLAVFKLPLAKLTWVPITWQLLRPAVMKSITQFHRKILRGFLKLSKSSPVPSMYFLLGELPLEAKLHIDLLTLFHNALSNKHTKIYDVMKYILMMSDDNSTTWAVHVRLLSQLYGLPDPLIVMQSSPISKTDWKSIILTKVTVYHERELRRKAAGISSLKYFNVQLLGLSGKPHPALLGINDTRQALKFRAHVKLLSGDFPSFEKLSSQQNCGPHCRLCPSPIESTQHILTECRATADIKQRLLPDLLNLVSQVTPTNGLFDPWPNHVLTKSEWLLCINGNK